MKGKGTFSRVSICGSAEILGRLTGSVNAGPFSGLGEREKTTQLVANRSIVTDMIYTRRTIPHTSGGNVTGLNALWGDMHVSFSTSKPAFDPNLWDPGDDHLSQQNPGDNTLKFRTIVSLLRP